MKSPLRAGSSHTQGAQEVCRQNVASRLGMRRTQKTSIVVIVLIGRAIAVIVVVILIGFTVTVIVVVIGIRHAVTIGIILLEIVVEPAIAIDVILLG